MNFVAKNEKTITFSDEIEISSLFIDKKQGRQNEKWGANLISLQRRNSFVAVGFIGRLSATKKISSLKDPNRDETISSLKIHSTYCH